MPGGEVSKREKGRVGELRVPTKGTNEYSTTALQVEKHTAGWTEDLYSEEQ